MKERIRILIIDDDDAFISSIIREISSVIPDLHKAICNNKKDLEYLLKDFKPDIILSDYYIDSNLNGIDVIKVVKDFDPVLPVIIISGSIGEDTAVECLKMGASDYILKTRIKRLPYSILEFIEKAKAVREKEQLLKKLVESVERYRSLFENSKLPMLLIDPENDLRIVEANRAAIAFYGYSKEEFTKLTVFDLNTLPREEVLKLADRAKTESQNFFDFQHMIKNGDIRYVNVASGPINIDGKIYLLSTIIDVTEKKVLEEKNRMFEEKLNITNKIESLGRLAGTIAHDFNNLLTPIIAYCDMGMRDVDKNSESYQYLYQIKLAAEKAATLTRQILYIGRKQILDIKSVDIKSFFRQIENILKRLVREDVTFRINLPDENLVANIDEGQLTQVLINLIVNALDAVKNSERKEIIVDIGSTHITKKMYNEYIDLDPGLYLTISVSDTGCGIPKENLSKIFEPFFTTKLDSGGSGLGLSICLGIIKQHKGDIKVYSEVGVGTTFKILLPASKDEIQEEVEVNDDLVRLDCDILLVEDEKLVADSIARGLEKYGCRVLVINDTSEVIDKVLNEDYRFDILVSDIVMPKYDGKQLYLLLKGVIEDLKVIFVSGYPNSVLMDQLSNMENIDFLQKPFDLSALVRKIKNLLNRKIN